MKKETQEIINLVKPITSSVIENYEKLAELETHHLEITEEYFQTIVKLNSSIKLEYEIISRIFKDTNEVIKALEDLSKITDEEINSISKSNKEDLINHRILEIIRHYAISNPKKIIELDLKEKLKSSELNPEVYNELIEMDDETKEAIENNIRGRSANYICMKALQTDINLFFIILLNRKIENEPNKRVKTELIKAKYFKISITPLLEEALLNQAFRIPTELYQSANMLPKVYGIDFNILQNFINEIKNAMYNTQINFLTPTSRKSYVYKSEVELYLREIKLRIALSYFTEEEIIKANEEFHENFDSMIESEYESFFKDLNTTITKAFTSFNKDKTLIRKVTIGN